MMRQNQTKGIDFHRKAMASTIYIVVTLVVVFGVGLLIYLIASGNLTKFGEETGNQQDDLFKDLNCVKACTLCCSTGSANSEYKAKSGNTCPKEDDPATKCGTCTCS